MSYFDGIKTGDKVNTKPNKEDYCTMVLYKENTEVKTIYDENNKVKAVRKKHLFKCSLCGETILKRCDNEECKKKKYMCKCIKKTYSNACKFYRTYSKEGVIKSLYSNNVETSRLRGHSKPAYSLEELMNYLINNETFNKLYEDWVNNNFKKSLRPSIDRIDSNKGYSFDNIQIVTFHQNQLNYKKEIRSGNRKIWNQKKVCKIDKDTNEVIECYKSASEAGEINNISYKTILKCCNGYLKTYKGFVWKFKDEIKFEIPKKPKIELKEIEYFICLNDNEVDNDEDFTNARLGDFSLENGLFRNDKETAEKSLKTIKKFTRLLALRDEMCPDSRGYEPDREEHYTVYFDFNNKKYTYDINYYNYIDVPLKTKEDAQKICDILNEGRFDLDE